MINAGGICLLALCLRVNLLSGLTKADEECPCHFDEHQLTADCTFRDLNNVPECVPNNTRQLLLGGNKFRNVSSGLFQRFHSLDVLNLDSNELEYLSDEAFSGLHQLKTLSIAHNLLTHNDSFSDDVFRPLKSIQNVYIQGNYNGYTQGNVSYPDTALSKIPTLSFLFLDGLSNSSLGDGFKSLTNIHTIKMDSDVGFCDLHHIPHNMFWNLRNTSISHIELNHCEIRSLLPYTFYNLTHLETLIITMNRHMSSDGIVNVTKGLNSKRLKTLNLTDVFRDLQNTNLPADMFKDIRNSQLETLDLSGDKILIIDPQCISDLPKSLKFFSLRDNIIGNAHFLEKIYRLTNLEIMDMSFQNFYREEIITWGQDTARLSSLHASLISVFQNKTLGGNDIVKLPPHIRTIYMNNIKLGYPAPPLTFGPNNLRYLNASSCMIKAFLGPWFGMEHLETLDLSDNGMTVVIPTSFYGFPNLTSLYLHGNKIGPNILLDSKCELLSRQARLQVLDLTDNGFHSIPICMFEPLSNLNTLLLARNALTTITFRLDSLVHLKMLDLSYNEVMTMSKQTLLELDRISETTNLSMNVIGNRFSCGCKQKYFVQWLLSTKVLVLHLNNITCEYENHTLVSLAYTKNIETGLTNECSAWIVTTACAVTFVGMTLLLGLTAVICHRRGKYMYLFRTGRKTLNPYHKMKNETVTLNIDAYISYDQDYEVFGQKTLHQIIADRIYPALIQKGLRIKIREELYGNQILSTEISEQLQHCHKVVVFLTEEFCNDFANSHEFHVAATEGIYTNRKTIIPVLVGHSAWAKLRPEMRSYLESEEIAYFPANEDNLDEFINFLESRILRW